MSNNSSNNSNNNNCSNNDSSSNNSNNNIIQPDQYGRRLKYLRISVTPACNFKCIYCKPHTENSMSLAGEKILSYDDILFVSEVFAGLGVNRLRVTGGEPLVRKGIVPFLSKLSAINGIEEVMITTNGSLLTKYSDDLLKAGVSRLNISLDTLNAERFNYIAGTNTNMFNDTMAGIRTAIRTDFKQVKINAVMIKGFNDDELLDFVNFAAEENIIMRFIEFMPVGNHDLWSKENIITSDMILKQLAHLNPQQLQKDKNTGPAVNYKLSNGATIGIITPITKHFCDDCDKVRLTYDGYIRSCLLDDREIDINDAIKSRDTNMLIECIKEALAIKSKEYDKNSVEVKNGYNRTMSRIGG